MGLSAGWVVFVGGLLTPKSNMENKNFDNELWNRLLAHRGHTLVVTSYGKSPDDLDNVSLECEECGEIVLDAGLYTICARSCSGQQGQ